jgi:hypothetical protein
MTKQTDRLTPGQYTALTNLHHSASTTSLFFASVDYETSIQLLTDRWVRITEEGFVYLTQAGDKARIAESDTRFEEDTRPNDLVEAFLAVARQEFDRRRAIVAAVLATAGVVTGPQLAATAFQDYLASTVVEALWNAGEFSRRALLAKEATE